MKLKIIPLLLLLALLVSSCSKSEPAPAPHNTTGEDDGIVYSEPDTSGIDVTYILTDSGFVPLSICEGGSSMLSGENYYYNLQNKVENSRDIKVGECTIFTDSGKNCGTLDISEKNDYTPLYTLATTANWKLCPNIRKTTYDGEADSSYAQFIAESFADNFKTADDIVITNTWEYDVDSDGMWEAVVLAKSDGYCVLAFLSQTLGNKILASDFSKEGNYTAVPFFVDIDGNGVYTLATVCGGGLKTATVYKENSFDEDYRVYLPI